MAERTVNEDSVIKGLFVGTKKSHVELALVKYCYGRTFLDLGSGDGRVIQWAKEFGSINPRGVEYESYATDIKGDLFDLDFIQYDILFYFAKGSFQEQELLDKVVRESKGLFLLNFCFSEDNKMWYNSKLKNYSETLGRVNIYDFRRN